MPPSTEDPTFHCPHCEESIDHVRLERPVTSYESGDVMIANVNEGRTYRNAMALAEENMSWNDSPSEWDGAGDFTVICPECCDEIDPELIWGDHPLIRRDQEIDVVMTNQPQPRATRTPPSTIRDFLTPKAIGGSETLHLLEGPIPYNYANIITAYTEGTQVFHCTNCDNDVIANDLEESCPQCNAETTLSEI